MADEIKSRLGLDTAAFEAAIDKSIASVRKLRDEMQRGRATEVSQEERAQGRKRRALDQVHQQERRYFTESTRLTRRSRAEYESLADTIASKFAKAFRDVQRQEENSVDTLRDFHSVIGDVSVAFSALNKATEVADLIAQSWERAEENASQAAASAREYFKALRGEASLVGAPGVTSGVLSANLLMRLRTGMSGDEASSFVQMFESSLPAGMQKGNITREVADQFAVAAAQMLTRQGADPSTRGDLAGMIANFQQVGSAGEGLAALEAIRVGLTEGRGFDKPLTDALLQVAGQFVNEAGTGMMPSLPELSALIGVTSLSAGAGASGTRVEQLVRMLQGTTAEQMTFLKGLGVESDMNIMERLDTLVPVFRQLDQAAAQGMPLGAQLLQAGMPADVIAKRRDQIDQAGSVYELLVSAGFSAEGLKALNELIPVYDTLQQRVQKARTPIAGGAVDALNRQFLMSGIGQAMRAEQMKASAQELTGVNFMDTQTAVDIAQAQAMLAGEETSGVTQLADFFRPLWHGIPIPGAERGARLRVESRAAQMLREQIDQAGQGRDFQEFEFVNGPSDFFGLGLPYRDQIGLMLDFMRERQMEPFEGALAEGEQLAQAIGGSVEKTDELIATLSRLGVDVEKLRATIDRTYGPGDRRPANPPAGRGR